ncbi:MAG TPA: histidine phosphatase family protein [Cellulomonas sp.]
MTTTHRLVLLRHAKAEHGLDVPDVNRPLTVRGRRQSAEVGTALADAGLVPDLVLCSSSVRTRQTWELAKARLGAEPPVTYADELYDAGVDQVIAAVRAVHEAAGVVLVVGHEPAMSRTAAALAALGSDEATYARVQAGVPTGSWSVLAPIGPWADLARGSARLLRLVVPAT